MGRMFTSLLITQFPSYWKAWVSLSRDELRGLMNWICRADRHLWREEARRRMSSPLPLPLNSIFLPTTNTHFTSPPHLPRERAPLCSPSPRSNENRPSTTASNSLLYPLRARTLTHHLRPFQNHHSLGNSLRQRSRRERLWCLCSLCFTS